MWKRQQQKKSKGKAAAAAAAAKKAETRKTYSAKATEAKTKAKAKTKSSTPTTSTSTTPPDTSPSPLIDVPYLLEWMRASDAASQQMENLAPELVEQIDEAMIRHPYAYPASVEDSEPPETILRDRFTITRDERRRLEQIRDTHANVQTTIDLLTRRLAYACLFFLDETPVEQFTAVRVVISRLSLGLDRCTVELWRSVWKRDSYETAPSPLESFLSCLLSDYRVDDAKARRDYQFGTCAEPDCAPCRAIRRHPSMRSRSKDTPTGKVLLGGRNGGGLYEPFSLCSLKTM